MRKFVLSTHAYYKIAGDVTLAKSVMAAADDPTVTYAVTDKKNAGRNRQTRHIRDGIVAVVDEAAGKIITFYADVEETDLRPDQTDAEAQRYAAERANREARNVERARRDARRNARRERDRAFTAAQKSGKR